MMTADSDLLGEQIMGTIVLIEEGDHYLNMRPQWFTSLRSKIQRYVAVVSSSGHSLAVMLAESSLLTRLPSSLHAPA